ALPEVETASMQPAVKAQLDGAQAELADDPTDDMLNGRLGMLYLTYRFNEAAEVALRRARLLKPRRTAWPYYHAEALLRLGHYEEAAAALETVVEQAPDNVAAQVRLAVAQADSAGLEAAASTLDAAIAASPDRADAHFELGKLRLRQGDADAAIAGVTEALRLNGPFAAGYFALSEAHRRRGDRERSAENLALFKRHRNVNIKAPNRFMAQLAGLDRSAYSMLRRADQLNRQGRSEEAMALLRDASAADPTNMTAHSALLWAYGSLGDFGAVDRQFETAVKVNPDDPVLRRNLGRARVLEGRFVEAEQLLRGALESNPGDAKGFAWLGVALEKQGGSDREIDDAFAQALELDPDESLARTRLAERLVERSAYAEAGTHLEALARGAKGKDAARLWRALGENYLRLKLTDKARDAFETGLTRAREDRNRSEEAAARRALERLVEHTAG
ncbi:MAG: tetratricopeptide repeat protein, partial [Pseudomonadota bacterium]